MAEKSDENEDEKPEALGNDEDTEKGEVVREEAAASGTEAASEAEPESESASETEAKAESKADEDKDDADEEPARKDDAEKAKPAKAAKEKGGSGRWWIALVVVLVAEFYVYGRRGDIEVCVGKKDVHDFSLMGQERSDENRWKFPRCESRVNLGLRSQYDELVEDGTNVACRGATLFRNRGEGPQCVAQEADWTRQIETSYIWPWDSRYYEHLLWFIFDD